MQAVREEKEKKTSLLKQFRNSEENLTSYSFSIVYLMTQCND